MPLPKTATIAARATEVYCEAWSVILQRIRKMPPTRDSDLSDLSQLLPYLRQLLTCCACAGLLDNAVVSTTCGHCYCFECQYREPLLKIQCRQCRARTGLVMENQLQLVVECYKHMCHILGEELRKNPSVLDTIVNEDRKVPESPPKLNVSIKLASQDKDKNGNMGIVSLATVTVDDPIAEIIKEVEKGMKVSRAILRIKPPLKYLNSKIAAPCRAVVKKEVAPTSPRPVSSSVTTPSVSNDVPCLIDPAVKESSGNIVTKNRKGKSEQVRTSTKSNKKTTQTVGKEEIASTTRTLRKPRTAVTLRRNQSKLTRKGRVASKKVSKASTKPLSKSAAAAVPKVPATSPPWQGSMSFVHGAEMKVNGLSISVHCFDEKYLKTTSRDFALLPHAQPDNVLSEALSQRSGTVADKTSFKHGGWKESTQERKWSPLCPSVVVKRPREAIGNMLLLQCEAKAKKKSRRSPSIITQPTVKLVTKPAKSHKKHSRSSDAHLPKVHPLPPAPSPSILPRHPTGDLPLPENIPILPNDVNLEDDIDWKELSDFLESNDEESMTSLPPPLSGYAPPPQQHPPHIEPVHFDDHFGPRHLMPPPFMPPQHPGHLHLHPPPPLLGPPLGPHTPVMPFPPDMRPPVPHPDGSYFSPMMGPEDFLQGGGMGPDGGGYSSPMTPQRGYPPGGMCPMEYQRSPRHHHHHHVSQFSMPSPRMNFRPPPGGSFPVPPLPLPKQRRGSSNNSGNRSSNNSGTMSKMVSKMKIKSPAGQQRKKQLLSPTDGASPGEQGKKRRSPGYSEAGWRCRCGTNNVMFPDKVCAKGKCPCYTKGVACKNCLCRHCHNPFGAREVSTNLPADASTSEQSSE